MSVVSRERFSKYSTATLFANALPAAWENRQGGGDPSGHCACRRPDGPADNTASTETTVSLPGILTPFDLRSQRPQALVDPLVAPLDLPHVADHRFAFGRQGREQHRHAGADVGALDLPAAQLRGTGDHGAMRIAEHDACAHADQLVHEEEARFEHLLEDENRALALRRDYDRDRHQVGGERRPGTVLELRD